MDLLVWLEQSALARALKTSFVVYPLVNAAHIAAIGTLFAGVLLMDLRILGLFQAIPAEPFVALLRRSISSTAANSVPMAAIWAALTSG